MFPEVLEQRLAQLAEAAGLPLEALLLLPIDDPNWGQRLVALVRPGSPHQGWEELQLALQHLCDSWPPAERPGRWLLCPELAPAELGKWQQNHWRAWVDQLKAVEVVSPASVDVEPV